MTGKHRVETGGCPGKMWDGNYPIPGKPLHHNDKSPCLMEKLTIFMRVLKTIVVEQIAEG